MGPHSENELMEKTVFFLIEDLNSTFEVSEFKNLQKAYERVVLITTTKSGFFDLTEHAHLINFDSYTTSRFLRKAIRYLPVLIAEFFSTTNYLFNIRLYVNNVSTFLRSIFLADQIRSISLLYPSSEKIYYAYWFNNFATALSIIKRENKQSEDLSICRAHGIDLFEERVPVIHKIPFRRFQLKFMDYVFSVSHRGTVYLKERYPLYSSKIHTSYLGTADFGEGYFRADDTFTIVSCATIRNIKRVHLIPRILQHIDFPVRWVHFGEESAGDPTLDRLHANLSSLKETNKRVSFELLGNMSHERIMAWYRNQTTNLFISVSETEGIPVSMMEAISFGIPIMATDVGGCREIVTQETGILIPKDFDPAGIASLIGEMRSSKMGYEEFRFGVRSYWKSTFSEIENFNKFLKFLNGK